MATDVITEIAARVRDIAFNLEIPISVHIELDSDGPRITVRTAMDTINAFEYTNPLALLAWLNDAVADPLALAEGLKYQQLEVLKKRQKDDAESLDKLLAEQQAGPE